MTTRDKILLNIFLVGIVFLGLMIWQALVDDKPIDPKRLLWAVILIPVFGFMSWLRWDWAREKGRKVRAKRKAEKEAKTFE